MWIRRLSALLCASLASTYAATDDIKGGVLVKSSQQTSCNLIVMDSQTALVAASCLDFVGSGVVDSRTNYEVYLDDRMDGIAAKYAVEKISVQAHYDQTTLANNLAILQFNSRGVITWQISMAPWSNLEWDALVYDRRSLTDLGKMQWDQVSAHTTPKDADYGVCKDLSPNPVGLWAYMLGDTSTTVTPPKEVSDCPAPYGVVYGVTHRNGRKEVFLLAIHSFTYVAGGSSLCTARSQCSYYTFFNGYYGLIRYTLGRDFPIGLDEFNITDYRPNTNFQMAGMKAQDSAVATTLSGNLFKAVKLSEQSSPASTQSSSATSKYSSTTDMSYSDDHDGGSSGATTATTDTDTDTRILDTIQSTNDGLSQKSIIAVAVSVSVGGLVVIGVAVFFACRRWRRFRREMFLIGTNASVPTLGSHSGAACTDVVADDMPPPPPLYEAPPKDPLPPGTSARGSSEKDDAASKG
ncbi:hypothetical protein H4R19_001384 [Coemansia spiralis]|nr:hypothetical protein H4R19_001384 [Coemansia spiralis]